MALVYLQVGDNILYKDAKHSVKNFGLLSTEFIRYDGSRLWVRCWLLLLFFIPRWRLFQIQSAHFRGCSMMASACSIPNCLIVHKIVLQQSLQYLPLLTKTCSGTL
jgi:hypothetical protein